MIRLTLTAAATLLVGFALVDVSLAQNTGGGLFNNSRSVGTGGSFSTGERNLTSNRTTGDAGSGDAASGERFSRENRQGQFVGSDSGDFQNFLSQAANARGSNAAGGRGGQNGRNFNQGGQQQPARLIRATLRVAFSYPQRSTAAASTKIAKRINLSRAIQAVVPVEVTISNRTATLRGVVATAADRDLTVRLVLLESGISRVKNELTVASSDEMSDPTRRP